MKKITGFDKDNLKTIRELINQALKKIQEETGVVCNIGNITYDISGYSFTTKLQGKIEGEGADTVKIAGINRQLNYWGLQVGQKFQWSNMEMEVVDYKSARNAGLIVRSGNKMYGLDIIKVSEYLKNKMK